MVSKSSNISLGKSPNPSSRPAPAIKKQSLPIVSPNPVTKSRNQEIRFTTSPKNEDLKSNKFQHKKTSSASEVPSSTLTNSPLLYSYISKVGKNPDAPKKVNQDSIFQFSNFAGIPNCYLFGVCDGHGHFGKEISTFIKDRLPQLLASDSNLIADPKQAIRSSVEILQREILLHKYDTSFSGSTLNMIMILNSNIFCANVGDSRTVIGRKDLQKWTAVALSKDHKPDIPEERERILASGGRVEAYIDEETQEPYGPLRVWMRNLDYPGIAMSRSLGDSVAASIGVSSVPEITENVIGSKDKFIVMGSDGLFEFISNEDIVKIASIHWKKHDTENACFALAKVADERWRKEEDTIDDITCICIYLHP